MAKPSEIPTHEPIDQAEYAKTFAQLDKEALATFISALIVTIVFWLAIYLTHDLYVFVFAMPLWFVLSCIGGYIFSVICVVILVKFFMQKINLNVKSYSETMQSQTKQD